MGYNRITTPRAYIDKISYDLANGWRDLDDITTIQDNDSSAVTFERGSEADIFDMKPSNNVLIEKENSGFYIQFNSGVVSDSVAESNFLAILNHNLHTANAVFKVELSDNSDMSSSTTITQSGNYSDKINAEQDSSLTDHIDPAGNGWSLITWSTSTNNQYVRISFRQNSNPNYHFASDLSIGSMMYGEYIDFQSPNIDVNTQILYDGTDLVQSTGGSTFANSKYFGEPNWYVTIPWNVTTTSNQQNYGFNRRYGRTQHSMKLDYIADTSLFAPNSFANQDSPADWYDSDSIHSTFFNKIIGQHLPFLFSIDSSSTTEGDYGIYRLVENGFSARQVAPRIWNTNLDIIESW